MTVEGIVHRATQLGMTHEEAFEFAELLIAQAGGPTVSDTFFLFNCILWQQKEIKKLKDELACTKVEKNS